VEVLLLHRPISVLPPEFMKANMEIAKQILTKGPLGGGKLIAQYVARNQNLIICIVDVPSMDNVVPTLERMAMLGIDTEIIPVEKGTEALPKFEKAMAEMMKK
jgi:hypothetical protein